MKINTTVIVFGERSSSIIEFVDLSPEHLEELNNVVNNKEDYYLVSWKNVKVILRDNSKYGSYVVRVAPIVRFIILNTLIVHPSIATVEDESETKTGE